MQLSELDARFIRIDGSYRIPCPMKEADGIIFLCPKCYRENGGSCGTHSILCWFVCRVPDNIDPKPGRWVPSGTSIEDLTFVGDMPRSVFLTNPQGCGAHFHIVGGAIQEC